MKNIKLFLLIVVLAAIAFTIIKSVEQHFHAGHHEKTTLPVAQR